MESRAVRKWMMFRMMFILVLISGAGLTYVAAQPMGFVDTVGTTYTSRQHSGEVGRMIALDAFGLVHVSWMNAMDDNVPPTERHVFYNWRSPEGEWIMPGGSRVDPCSRAGYASLAVQPEGRGIVAYHGTCAGGEVRAHVCVDFLPGADAFECFEFPEQPYMMIEPHVAYDINDRIHGVFTDMTMEADSFGIWYSSVTYDTNTGFFEGTPVLRMGAQLLTSHNVACSRHSTRVAVAWSALRPDYEGSYHQYNNDIFLMLSEDGGATWSDVINVTSFYPPDMSALPDTLRADQDTLRSFNDCSLLFDQNDYLHIAFTTIGYWAIEDLTSVTAGMIWHWSEETGVFSPLADGWEEIDGTLPSSLDRIVQRPSLGMDTLNGFLYCTYMRTNPEDIPPSGSACADIWATVSTNGGMTWAEGTNLTRTVGNDSVSAHECDASLAEIVNGKLHIFYETYHRGSPSLNPMIYQEVETADIPATPTIPWRPLHVDYSHTPPAHFGTRIAFRLLPSYPNPFNSVTVIPFELEIPTKVSLIIYDILGREVTSLITEERLPYGIHRVSWAAPSQASGVFFAHLKADGKQAVQRLVVVK